MQACKLIMHLIRFLMLDHAQVPNPPKGETNMSKTASLLFAFTAVILMLATGVAISHNGWLAALFFVLTFVVIGAGFMYRAKALKRK